MIFGFLLLANQDSNNSMSTVSSKKPDKFQMHVSTHVWKIYIIFKTSVLVLKCSNPRNFQPILKEAVTEDIKQISLSLSVANLINHGAFNQNN